VTVLDDLSTGSVDNLALHMKKRSISFVTGDIRNHSLVADVLEGVDAVVHLAAITDHNSCLQKPQLAHDVNVNGTSLLLEEARKHSVRRFVYASSAAIYGEANKFPISEQAKPAPLAPYGASKLAGERQCLEYQRTFGLSTVCLRYFNIFGPRQFSPQYSAVFTQFIRRIQQNETPVIYGDGLQTRDFVNVRDVTEATLLALDSNDAAGVYNIASGKETTIEALAQTLIKISGKSALRPAHAPARQGEIRRSLADITKARSELQFTPKTDLETDLHELWESTLAKNRNSISG
jgi:UDP-glucose 4-epimerase